MNTSFLWGSVAAGFAAGAVNGLFGGGGGMVLIPLLSLFMKSRDHDLFHSSVAVILPICIISLIGSAMTGSIPWLDALPWLPGSAIGGYIAAKTGKKIPAVWLHRGLGILILYGGIRYLC